VAKARSGAILSRAARRDLRAVLHWSEENFGEAASVRYLELILQAIRDVGSDSDRPGSFERLDLAIPSAKTCHMSFSRTRVRGARKIAEALSHLPAPSRRHGRDFAHFA